MTTHQHHSTDSLQVPQSPDCREEDSPAASSLDSTRDLPCTDQGVKFLYTGVTYRDFGDPDELQRHLLPNGTESVLPISNEPRITQTTGPSAQDSSLDWRHTSLKTFGSQVLRWVKSKVKEVTPEVYLGLRWPDLKNPIDTAKRNRGDEGYKDSPKTNSTERRPQTTVQSRLEPSNRDVSKQKTIDPSFSGTAAASFPSSCHLPDNPKDVSCPPSLSDSQSLEKSEDTLSVDNLGWNPRSYYGNPGSQDLFEEAVSIY